MDERDKSRHHGLDSSQPRILMFAYDGTGLGHLKRLCRVASELQPECAVLIVTGQRAASWLVPKECEYVHLPSFDSIYPHLSRRWGREPFWRNAERQGRHLRKAILDAVVAQFRPNVIILDYLPMGKDEEMFDILWGLDDSLRYFLLRGVLDSATAVKDEILNEKGSSLLENKYDRILVASDSRVVDVVEEYHFPAAIASKVTYTGYITETIRDSARRRYRKTRGIPRSSKWVVCSAGGGLTGEDLVEHCCRLVDCFPEVYFDLILGPRSTLSVKCADTTGDTRIRISTENASLPLLHSACDVVICRGGYNSLLESIAGHAQVIVVPKPDSLEQQIHSERLRAFHELYIVTNLELLQEKLRSALLRDRKKKAASNLHMDGASEIKRIIISDLQARAKGRRHRDRFIIRGQ
jgi:predicted glycosyltransferase